MPEIKHFEVSQTRTVRVTANNPADAAAIASAAFNGESKDTSAGPWGHIKGKIEVTNLNVTKEL